MYESGESNLYLNQLNCSKLYNIYVSERGQYPRSIGDRRRGGHSLPVPLVGLAVGSGIVGDEAIPGLSARLNLGVIQAGFPDKGPFTHK